LYECITIGIITSITSFTSYSLDRVNLNPFTDKELELYGLSDESIIIITPLLTANAYKVGGFYTYFNGSCGLDCLDIDIDEDIRYRYTSSVMAVNLFKHLGANIVTDYNLNLRPEAIHEYDKVVVLHNEYVTKEIFQTLQNHPQVFYLYPNAMYAEIEINDSRMKLIRGHQYPNQTIKNGFDWEYENTPLEYITCNSYNWTKIRNGYQLGCYPELYLLENKTVFGFIKNT